MDIAEYRARWEQKPVLREIYDDFYRRLFAACRPGRTLEIGGGTGNMAVAGHELVCTDIQWAPWLDCVADAQQLPFAESSFDNIVMVDVLHHIECPRRFFAEARRVLRPGGRLAMLEPAMTPLARLFYTYLHDEPVDMRADPLGKVTADPHRNPYDANSAIPELIFGRDWRRFQAMFPEFRLKQKRRLSLFAYPLSGGFKAWSLLPCWATRPLLGLEEMLMPLLGPVLAFRTIAVLERG